MVVVSDDVVDESGGSQPDPALVRGTGATAVEATPWSRPLKRSPLRSLRELLLTLMLTLLLLLVLMVVVWEN